MSNTLKNDALIVLHVTNYKVNSNSSKQFLC